MTTHRGYADRSPVKRPEWHSLIAWDMFFNNITTGLFLVAALCELSSPSMFRITASWAYPTALAFLIADLICLVLDLGDPLRFHHMLRVFKPSSPMSLGTWCLTIYSLPLTLVVAVELLAPQFRWLRWLALIGGLIPAFGSAVYKGVLISTSSQEGWKDARWLGGYLANSAIMIGCAGMLFLAVLTRQERASARLRTGLAVLILLNMIPSLLLAIDVRGAFFRLYPRSRVILLAWIVILGAVVVPLALLVGNLRIAGDFLAVGMLLATSLLVRFYLVQLAHGDH